jgi:hypothetical protein
MATPLLLLLLMLACATRCGLGVPTQISGVSYANPSENSFVRGGTTFEDNNYGEICAWRENETEG